MNNYLFPGLEFGPKVVARIMEDLDPSVLDSPTAPNRFTPREVVAHLADWEPILRGRMQSAKDNPGGPVHAIDEGERAKQQKYGETDWKEQCRLFRERRAETIAWLRALKDEDWNLHAMHSERGRETIYDMANMFLGHDLYHIEQLTGLKGEKTVGTW